MTNIPNSIKEKLKRVERLQNTVQEILAEIDSYKNVNDGCDDSGWSFSMHVDANGEVMKSEDSIALLETFLQRANQKSQ